MAHHIMVAVMSGCFMPVCAACFKMPFYSVLTTLGGNLDITGEETERLVE